MTVLRYSGMLRVRRFAIALAALLAELGATPRASADPRAEACSIAYTKGQEDRLAGRLYSAWQAFGACAESACSDKLTADCAKWRAEVAADLPTVRFKVTTPQGTPIAPARVFADGVSVSEAALANPVILEAGPHAVHVEVKGYRAVDAQIALRPTDRELEVALVVHAVDEPASVHSVSPAFPVPVAAIALAGAGVVALGGSLYFGLRSHEQYQALKARCAPYCSPADADAVRSKALVSDLALLASVAAFGAATWIFFAAAPNRGPRAALNIVPSRDGASARLRVAF